jgi:hypothetical protein
MSTKLTQKRLKEVLHYNPDTGIFTWILSNSNRIHKGDKAGCNSNGYISIGVDGSRYRAHVLAWLYMEGYFPENDIDHINRIKSDNKWKNLRHVSRSCNLRNNDIRSNNTSGLTGIRLNCNKSKWIVEITINNKNIYLGRYINKVDAVMRRWHAEIYYQYDNCNSTSTAYLYLKRKGILV